MDTTERKIRVDRDRCQGHARCIALAPELFVSDEYGNGVVRSDVSLTPQNLEKARLAQQSCPEFAITIERSR